MTTNAEEVTEPKSGVTLPIKLDDGKQLISMGVRKKSVVGIGVKIYGFGMYAETEKLRDVVKSKVGNAPPRKATKEMYDLVIDSDLGMLIRLVIVYSNITMSMVRKSFDESLGASIKNITGSKNEDLTKKIMGEASGDIKLAPGSVIEISRLPRYTLQTKVTGKVVGSIESELLCKAFIYLYLGDDPLDKEAKDKFGESLISLL